MQIKFEVTPFQAAELMTDLHNHLMNSPDMHSEAWSAYRSLFYILAYDLQEVTTFAQFPGAAQAFEEVRKSLGDLQYLKRTLDRKAPTAKDIAEELVEDLRHTLGWKNTDE